MAKQTPRRMPPPGRAAPPPALRPSRLLAECCPRGSAWLPPPLFGDCEAPLLLPPPSWDPVRDEEACANTGLCAGVGVGLLFGIGVGSVVRWAAPGLWCPAAGGATLCCAWEGARWRGERGLACDVASFLGVMGASDALPCARGRLWEVAGVEGSSRDGGAAGGGAEGEGWGRSSGRD
jgi:hypothetical protein